MRKNWLQQEGKYTTAIEIDNWQRNKQDWLYWSE